MFPQVLMCSSIEELNDYVAPDQLTEDLGGTISYNHHEWIQHRAVSTLTHLTLISNLLLGGIEDLVSPKEIYPGSYSTAAK